MKKKIYFWQIIKTNNERDNIMMGKILLHYIVFSSVYDHQCLRRR